MQFQGVKSAFLSFKVDLGGVFENSGNGKIESNENFELILTLGPMV